MPSIRRRLTLGYAIALLASVGAFGGALYLERQRSGLRELDERLELEGNLAAQYFISSQRQLGRTLHSGETPTLVISAVGGYLDGIRDYVVVFDPERFAIYRNEVAKQFGVIALSQVLAASSGPGPGAVLTGVVTIEGESQPFRYAQVPLPGVWEATASIFVAAPIDAVPFGAGQLLQAMLVIAPVILLGSIGLGYVMADMGFRPLDRIVDELAAITDGRSLHRRVAVPSSADELARLANTMNRMLSRLEASFTTLRRFTADASHEMKTPLMVLRAGVERSMTHPGTPTEALQSLEEVLEEIHRVSEMVENLLTLARADEGGAILATEPCDLRELVSEASETAGMLAEEHRITVRTELPKESVVAPVDRSRVRQLLLNLVTNAIKFTPPGGKVSLALVDQGETVTLIVGDDGIGIPLAALPHIFDRFYRVDTARSRTGRRPGTGLGLAITRWIAEAHGGSISVQSRPGRGAVFTVSLPKAAGAGTNPVPQDLTATGISGVEDGDDA
ncbi:MAG: HAMP domain-containing sensor histidine kinase [Gemmatimonadales bacterium]